MFDARSLGFVLPDGRGAELTEVRATQFRRLRAMLGLDEEAFRKSLCGPRETAKEPRFLWVQTDAVLAAAWLRGFAFCGVPAICCC